MNFEKIILPLSESEKVEFKTSFNENVIETLVAFSNTKGGMVYIGIADNFEIKGVMLGMETIPQWINEIKNKTAPQIIPDIEVINVDGKNIVQIIVKEYPVKPVSSRGRYYKRVGNSNHVLSVSDVVNLHLKTVNSSWDFYLKDHKLLNDISFDKVQKIIDIINRRNKGAIEDDPLTFLRKFQLISDEKITHACWLLFMPDMDICTTVELGRFSGSTIIKDSITLHTDLLSETENIMNFIFKHINKQVIIKNKLENEERWDYPIDALRELVLNMVIHRDYTSSYDSVVKVFDNYIEFYNPGSLPTDIDLDHLMNNDYVSQPRNKLIAEIFKASGLIEKYGSGIKRVLNAFSDYGLKQPEFRVMESGFRVKVFSAKNLGYKDTNQDTNQDTNRDTNENIVNDFSNKDTIKDTIKDTNVNIVNDFSNKDTNKDTNVNFVNDFSNKYTIKDTNKDTNVNFVNDFSIKDTNEDTNKITFIQSMLLQAIKNNSKITITELSIKAGINVRNTKNNLLKLKNAGLIKREGNNKTGYWEIL